MYVFCWIMDFAITLERVLLHRICHTCLFKEHLLNRIHVLLGLLFGNSCPLMAVISLLLTEISVSILGCWIWPCTSAKPLASSLLVFQSQLAWKAVLSVFGLQQTVIAVLADVQNAHASGVRILKQIEIVSKHFHLHNGVFNTHGLYVKVLHAHNLALFFLGSER